MTPPSVPSKARSAALLVLVALLAACAGPARQASAPAEDPVARGAYLVNLGGCHDCHTPKVMTAAGPVPDTTRSLSGHPASEALPALPAGVIGPDRWGAVTNNGLTAWVGPWGTSFTANLTPDRTGLAGWTPEVFIETIRQGKHAGVGRALLPPMPWQMYAHMTDEDLRAVFAYLQSLPPVSNAVPAPLPPAT
ncbi:MAG: c-type cytochrome [Gemmatimonadota bacterium]|nr:c-type cytochrome [Gemmatimonadota bacterium]